VKVEFPIIVDPERKVARLYGMLGYQDDTPAGQSDGCNCASCADTLLIRQAAQAASDGALGVHHRSQPRDSSDSDVSVQLRTQL
jgi:hypothetical protein